MSFPAFSSPAFSIPAVWCRIFRSRMFIFSVPEMTWPKQYVIRGVILITCVSYAEARNRYRLDLRPSVCPSVTRWHPIKTAEYIVMLSSPHDSPFILVLCTPRSSRNSDGVTPCGGAKYRWGIKFARFSTNKSLYLANDTRRRIGTHTRSIKWCHFQWPWMNPNPVFKVRIFFDAEYLQNDCKYGHSYYGRW